MFIKDICWLDRPSSEAILCVSDSKYLLTCFSCPCEYSVGDRIDTPLECFDVRNIEQVDENSCEVINKEGTFPHIITARMHSVTEGLARVGSLMLHIKPDLIPKDIQTGQFIRFSVSRIDLF